MLGLVVMAGCAKTVVDSHYESAKWNLEKPSQIYVYDFAMTRDQVHENAGLLQGTINDFQDTTTYQHQGEIMGEVRTVAADELVKGSPDNFSMWMRISPAQSLRRRLRSSWNSTRMPTAGLCREPLSLAQPARLSLED